MFFASNFYCFSAIRWTSNKTIKLIILRYYFSAFTTGSHLFFFFFSQSTQENLTLDPSRNVCYQQKKDSRLTIYHRIHQKIHHSGIINEERGKKNRKKTPTLFTSLFWCSRYCKKNYEAKIRWSQHHWYAWEIIVDWYFDIHLWCIRIWQLTNVSGLKMSPQFCTKLFNSKSSKCSYVAFVIIIPYILSDCAYLLFPDIWWEPARPF